MAANQTAKARSPTRAGRSFVTGLISPAPGRGWMLSLHCRHPAGHGTSVRHAARPARITAVTLMIRPFLLVGLTVLSACLAPVRPGDAMKFIRQRYACARTSADWDVLADTERGIRNE